MTISEDLIGFRLAFPFLAALAVAEIFIDPGDESSSQRDTEVFSRELGASHRLGHQMVDLEDCRAWVGSKFGDWVCKPLHLDEQFFHVRRAGPRSCLVGHARHPSNEPFAKQSVKGHEHQRDRAIATCERSDFALDPLADDVFIDRVEDDDRVLSHSQRGSRIDPIAVPTLTAESLVYGRGVITTLGREDHIHLGEPMEVMGVLENPSRCRSR